ncbi:hypothetical protein ACFLVR_04340 [Chloroflexota bacterium]
MEPDTAKISSIRSIFGIPYKGFSNEREALAWYRTHYKKALGKSFLGGFGYRYPPDHDGPLGFDCQYDPETRKYTIADIPPLDLNVPLDNEAWAYAKELDIDWFSATAIRLILLIAPLTVDGHPYMPYIPRYLFAPLGEWQLCVQSPGGLSTRERRELLDKRNIKVITEGYFTDRTINKPRQYSKMIPLYLDVLQAYEEEKEEGPNRIRGYLQRIAQRLVSKYDWEYEPESYTVKRYLDRALKMWGTQDIINPR